LSPATRLVMNSTRRLLFLLSTVLAGSAACTSVEPGPEGVSTIRTTTSFGFCLGYCRTILEVTAEGMVFIEEPTRQADLPRVVRTAPISAEEWRSLVAAVDRAALEALPPTVGCPDCADGGAESVEVIGRDWRDEVTFEFNAALPQLQPLLSRLRPLRERFPRTDATP
jgi:hypothetical protein